MVTQLKAVARLFGGRALDSRESFLSPRIFEMFVIEKRGNHDRGRVFVDFLFDDAYFSLLKLNVIMLNRQIIDTSSSAVFLERIRVTIIVVRRESNWIDCNHENGEWWMLLSVRYGISGADIF